MKTTTTITRKKTTKRTTATTIIITLTAITITTATTRRTTKTKTTTTIAATGLIYKAKPYCNEDEIGHKNGNYNDIIIFIQINNRIIDMKDDDSDTTTAGDWITPRWWAIVASMEGRIG